MNIRKKLHAFEEMAVREAEGKYASMLTETAEKFESARAEMLRKAESDAKKLFEAELYKMRLEKNMNIARAESERKQTLYRLRENITDEVYAAARVKLSEFSASPGYRKFLLQKMDEIIGNGKSGKNAVSAIVLNKPDMIFSEGITAEYGIPVTESEDDIIGGFILRFEGNKAVLDKSFKTGLNEMRLNKKLFEIINPTKFM